ncbi:M50 family metallopeptidase [Shewanella sp. 10N.286.48.B5]|uniref:M50 family metallopeptidase n=1 Tax=Shewanella sp. 10N.286.48.B5 TaxID=1880834 RepID=UPI000C83E6DB|nr:M50 family metallopeptidase [Shewanella sp. 10N.286.48.B5]PMH87650.1 membrane zinc metalloprotease [Shewanella sp. 10N.286.48.B5]
MHDALPNKLSAIPSKGRFFLELLFAFLITKLPFISIPFKWFESYFHEISHGIAAILSGGIVTKIQLFPNGAGLCFTQGGFAPLITFSGYPGAALWGYMIFLLATWRAGIRFTLGILGITVIGSLILWARDLLTIGILISLAVVFLLPLKFDHNALLNSLLRVMGLMIVLNAMASPTVLFRVVGQGDAAKLSQLTWIPAWIWVIMWLIFSCFMLWMCWKRVDDKKLPIG